MLSDGKVVFSKVMLLVIKAVQFIRVIYCKKGDMPSRQNSQYRSLIG